MSENQGKQALLRCRAVHLSCWAILSIFGSFPLWSQGVTTSQISGIVQDSNGLGVPAAEVKITNTDTGLWRMTVSGATGLYLIPNLPPGHYQLRASKPGFSTFEQSGIALQVNTNPESEHFSKRGIDQRPNHGEGECVYDRDAEQRGWAGDRRTPDRGSAAERTPGFPVDHPGGSRGLDIQRSQCGQPALSQRFLVFRGRRKPHRHQFPDGRGSQ